MILLILHPTLFNIFSGERLYSCSFCHKSFTHSAGYKAHLHQVHGQSPFKCGECGNKYAFMHELRKHLTESRHEENEKKMADNSTTSDESQITRITQSEIIENQEEMQEKPQELGVVCHVPTEFEQNKHLVFLYYPHSYALLQSFTFW